MLPLPWAVGHHILGFFILKCGQISLYPGASSNLCWSAALLKNSFFIWMLWSSFSMSIQTVSSQRGWASQRVPKNPWILCHPCLLWLWPPLQVNVPLIGSVVNIIILFWPPIEGLLQDPHPLFNIIGHSWSLGRLCLSLWSCWSSGLHFLLYHSLHNGMATLSHGFH